MDPAQLMFKPGLLNGKRILVTGGGTGLGKEMTEAYLALGAEVAILGRRGGVLEETAAALMAKHGGVVRAFPCDIRQPDAVHDAIDRIWSELGPLDALINNAAGNFIARTEDLSTRAFDAIANIVFHGSFYVTLDVGKRWIAEKRPGSVVSMLATWVWTGSAFTVPSAMSKTALHAMTQSLAVEWGRYGIRLNAIAPGPFPTEGAWARLNPGDGSGGAGVGAGNPMGRVGRMEELCNLAVFLVAPGADYLTGQTIAIDGAALQAGAGTFARLMDWTDAQWAEARTAIQSANQMDRAQRTP